MAQKTQTKVKTILNQELYNEKGEVSGKIALPKSIFDSNVNKQVLAQSIRVYLNNQRAFSASTKTS